VWGLWRRMGRCMLPVEAGRRRREGEGMAGRLAALLTQAALPAAARAGYVPASWTSLIRLEWLDVRGVCKCVRRQLRIVGKA
jgi:hypothetical protein